MVESVLKAQDRSVPVKLVHASRGKVIRAEPISTLYEQKRVHHVGSFDKLEDQMTVFSVDNVRNSSTGSPDRVDALVWGLTEIFDKIAGRARPTKNTTRAEIKKQQEFEFANDRLANVPTGWMA